MCEERLGRILTFFGVPWRAADVAELGEEDPRGSSYAVLGNVQTLALAFDHSEATAAVVQSASALFGYAVEDEQATARALSALAGGQWRTSTAGGSPRVVVSGDRPELTGAMTSVRATLPTDAAHRVLQPPPDRRFVPLVTVNDDAAFVHTRVAGVAACISASATVVDIDDQVTRNFYDVKEHFLAAVPVVMFVTSVFREVTWQPRELGACLIIDDPLLKGRYGFCDFPRLRDQMREHWFTTNIAFIPWNWRRTTRRASEFFRRESSLFSVSVHGCDHIAAEFGAASPEVIDERARLAQLRMRKHQARTRIKHDPIMVFPQGVFSASCPAVLKRNGFVAAVNTEVSPINGPKTLVRDVWDTAVMRYGAFPIYTRRYLHHGIENFAFDLLLGKPCFIVAHHEEFRDGGTALVGLVNELRKLHGTLEWRSPRAIVRRAYRVRHGEMRSTVQMFATELLLANDGNLEREFEVTKVEGDPASVERVSLDGAQIPWLHAAHGVQFRCTLPPRSEALVKIRYRGKAIVRPAPVSMRYGLAVAARRILSELRDEYVLRFARA